MSDIDLVRFCFYLSRHKSFVLGSVQNSIFWVRCIEDCLNESMDSLLSRFGSDELKTQIGPDNPAFNHLTLGYLENCRVGVTRYHEYQQWWATQA